MRKSYTLASFLALLVTASGAAAHVPVHITHQYTNLNAQSLIGLPMGSHKTIVDKQGDLRWSQWSLKRRGLDVPFGFSAQLDGALDTRLFLVPSSGARVPLKVSGQELYQGRFPFIVTKIETSGVRADELAFPVSVRGQGMDLVRIRITNTGANAVTVEALFSGKRRNLPAFARSPELATEDGYLVALAQSTAGTFTPMAGGLALVYRVTLPGRASATVWLKRPYAFPAKSASAIASLPGSELLSEAVQSWQKIWSQGAKISLPEREIDDFFYSSLAYVLILTERGPAGDLWTLDGPAGYRQYWARGEYFQARALEVAGHVDVAGQTVEHTFRLQKDDGEWDWPAISGWPAWDSFGGEAGSVWDYYQFTHDKQWLARADPYLLNAARWIGTHREETEVPANAPAGAKPIRRQIPFRCMEEPNPPLAPGEKPYWWGLLPWGYGDSGLPEGHAFSHNVMALYAVKCAWLAARELGRQADAAELWREYNGYKQAILTAIHRSVQLEKQGPPYLPAMPTYPQAAVSQSFLAVYPTHLFSPADPLVTGLLTRIERTEIQGLPTNMAWMGPSGVWPGESMNVAETYLRRGELGKTAALLIAALNHSYSTDVWKEEIKVDDTLPVACPDSHKKRADQTGTGDMPEAWANANLVNLVRDMLLYEDGRQLRLLSGIPADWIGVGESIQVENAPTIFGGPVSFRLSYPAPGAMALELTPPPAPVGLIARFPIGESRAIQSVRVNGRPIPTFSGQQVRLNAAGQPLKIEITFR